MDNAKERAAKTYQVRISENTIRNIDEITGYIAFINQQPLNAIKVGEAIFKVFVKIEQNPYSFKECDLLLKEKFIARHDALVGI